MGDWPIEFSVFTKMNNPSSPHIFVLLRPSLYEILFPPETDRALHDLGYVVLHDRECDLTWQELAARIAGFDAVVTGWGSPTFTGEVLAAADRLRLIAHSAGTVKAMLPPAVFERGIAVTHAASAIAPAVAEASPMCCLLLLHQARRRDRALRAGDWEGAGPALGLGQELGGQRVGVIGAGYTGRCFMRLLRALEAEVWVYDPYNVFITPHTAGATVQARRRQGQAVVEEVRRFFAGQPLRWQVTAGMLGTTA